MSDGELEGPHRVAQAARSQSRALWTLGFRPFFFAASGWAAVALAVWAVVLATGRAPPSRFDPLTWHIHEMLFGFLPAAIAGFLLTAVPNWTGRRPLHGRALAGLALLWLAGRAVCLVSNDLPYWPAAAVDLAFPFAIAALMLHEVIAARSWRNVAMPIPVAVLGVADLLMYLERAGFAVATGLGWRLGLAAVLILASAVGGRIIPAFTRNWLAARGRRTVVGARSPIDWLALGTLHVGLLGWAFWPDSRSAAVLLLASAALLGMRLVRWRAFATIEEPLLAVLHVGYGWLGVGVALLGVSMLSVTVPLEGAIHALTVGAIGTLVLAVMTRVSLGHTGRALEADRATTSIYVLVNLAAAVRVAASFASAAFLPLVLASAVLWVSSFVVFWVRYAGILAAPRAG